MYMSRRLNLCGTSRLRGVYILFSHLISRFGFTNSRRLIFHWSLYTNTLYLLGEHTILGYIQGVPTYTRYEARHVILHASDQFTGWVYTICIWGRLGCGVSPLPYLLVEEWRYYLHIWCVLFFPKYPTQYSYPLQYLRMHIYPEVGTGVFPWLTNEEAECSSWIWYLGWYGGDASAFGYWVGYARWGKAICDIILKMGLQWMGLEANTRLTTCACRPLRPTHRHGCGQRIWWPNEKGTDSH